MFLAISPPPHPSAWIYHWKQLATLSILWYPRVRGSVESADRPAAHAARLTPRGPGGAEAGGLASMHPGYPLFVSHTTLACPARARLFCLLGIKATVRCNGFPNNLVRYYRYPHRQGRASCAARAGCVLPC